MHVARAVPACELEVHPVPHFAVSVASMAGDLQQASEYSSFFPADASADNDLPLD
jgi:hypothetical protein